MKNPSSPRKRFINGSTVVDQSHLLSPHEHAQCAHWLNPNPFRRSAPKRFINQDNLRPHFDRQRKRFRLPRIKRAAKTCNQR
ncbi:MAG TPA: hypothetical protein VGQ99_09155 [Tepidisphaeraceae bacterium]|nr:hypothetical protein [Tepidisphaeraceae bacterium]